MINRNQIDVKEEQKTQWNTITGIPQEISLCNILAYKGKLYAGGTNLSETNKSSVRFYVSEDNGVSWKDFPLPCNELSSLSVFEIVGNRIFIAGRKGELQQKWIGATFYYDI